MTGFTQPDDSPASVNAPGEAAAAARAPAEPCGGSANPALEEPELEAALQLLVERAQYITGATGTALALPQGDEMVCRASAGSCAPAVGARLQVRSGLTGESIARRQLLRCDNAETDPRVNLEACRALGIASIVVLPLLRRSGELRGLFELFSDHPYAFEERDLSALERMADLTLTALDLAEQRDGAVPPTPPERQPERQPAQPVASSSAAVMQAQTGAVPAQQIQAVPVPPSDPAASKVAMIEGIGAPARNVETGTAAAAAVPYAMHRAQKCSGCGFPVSEGRTLCLDCERKQDAQRDQAQDLGRPVAQELEATAAAAPSPEAALPAFLANAVPVKESWLADHLNLLALIVLILGALVVIVIFR